MQYDPHFTPDRVPAEGTDPAPAAARPLQESV